LVLSPVETNRLPFASNAIEPAVWQHWSRCTGTSSITFGASRSIESPFIVNRASWFRGVPSTGE
jgi:hypothetical protein